MPISTSEPIAPTRIEPKPEVGAFFDRALSLNERCAAITAGMIFAGIIAKIAGVW